MIKRLIMLFVAAVLSAAQPAAAQQDQSAEARQFIVDLAGDAVSKLANSKAPLEQRTAELRSLMDRGFDSEEIGRLILARYWRRATPEQQQEFVSLLKQYVVRLYTRQFQEVNGIGLDVGDAKAVSGRYQVESTIKRPGKSPVQLVWTVEQSDGQWKVVDLAFEGISMVITQRNEFGSVIQRNGGQVSALLDLLRKKAGG